MNRIYQGRVQRLEFITTGDASTVTGVGRDQSVCPLWTHHTIFQDAVNYYLVALASLADPSMAGENRVIGDLRAKIAESWEDFPRTSSSPHPPRSLRDSLGRWLGLGPIASLNDCFGTILQGNTATAEARALALGLLLQKCGGEAAIQQGGRGYFPRLCVASATPTWDFSESAISAATGKSSLAEILYSNPTEKELQTLARTMDLSWTVKVQPGKAFSAEESKDRVREAINHLLVQVRNPPSQRFSDAIAAYPDAEETLLRYLASVPNLADDLSIPRNRKASKDLTFATIAFLCFPSPLTAAILKLGVAKPSSKGSAATTSTDFGRLGDDPIKLARGDRGYVFPAFTALEGWQPKSSGEPVWKEFDIAAFKEALKALNQFNQKTQEREENRRDLLGRLGILLGDPVSGWKARAEKESDGGETLKDLTKDPRFALARELEARLSEELNETVQGETKTLPVGGFSYRTGAWRISRANLRGFREISGAWNQALKKKGEGLSEEDLKEIVTTFQQDEKNKKSIGSLPLFLALTHRRFWDLWMTTGDDDDEESESNETPRSMLSAMVGLHQMIRDYERSREKIRLTPAEPRISRRLFMFSDLTDKLSRPKYGTVVDSNGVESHWVESAIAVPAGNALKAQRVRLHFSAPRLRRDELLDGGESRWLQPMTAGLGIEIRNTGATVFDSAVSLMPDFDREGNLRHLLNFPVTLDPDPIHKALGKNGRWNTQFNGIKDKHLHLHWPGTATEVAKRAPWWENETNVTKGFTVLSTDLGQRTAGAWALLRITRWDPRSIGSGTTKPVRRVGNDGTHEWFAEVLASGMHRLVGEDAIVQNKHGKFVRETGGKAGREASHEEWREACEVAKSLLADEPEAWIGAFKEKSFPEQNDALITLCNRRLTRLNTFHRWSCFDPDRPEVRDRRQTMIAKLVDELEAWRDPEIRALIPTLGSRSDNFAHADPAQLREAAGKRFLVLRSELEGILLRIVNRAVPLRKASWAWRGSMAGSPYGGLVPEGPAPASVPLIRRQRGLSMARLEQVEGVRKLFLRYNRALDREPGKPAAFGFADRGRESGEPCQHLLTKIDAMKEERVNQTAHLILAQALGVRLKPHELGVSERDTRDLHGEYERIPGREPVDFIVIENLDRYLTSQGRAPSENSRLMKWAHRAVRDKIKMLAEEPFGIPVVEVNAAYSSRFCARTAEPGARCVERVELELYEMRIFENRAVSGTDQAAKWRTLLDQFNKLKELNKGRDRAKGKLRSLFVPQAGGPLFLSAKTGRPVQADINAAINLGLRAVAAPERIDLLHKVRSERKAGGFVPVTKNAREKAAFKPVGEINLHGEASRKLSQSSSPNFFYDGACFSTFDPASVGIGSETVPLASGVGMWGTVNQRFLDRILEVNQERLESWMGTSDEDQIPGIG